MSMKCLNEKIHSKYKFSSLSVALLRLSRMAVQLFILGIMPVLAFAQYKTGLLPSPKEKVENLVKYISPVSSLPSTVDNSAGCPPVGDQGNQGSCASWAIGYYYKSYQEAKDQNWSLTTANHQFSPAFLYNQINGGTDSGSTLYDNINILVNKGCASLRLMPYDDTDLTTWPTAATSQSALPYRAKDMAFFFITNGIGDNVIDAMKQHLNNGDIFVLAIPVYENFFDSNNTFYAGCNYFYNEVSGKLAGGHAVTIVGYDDNVSSCAAGGCSVKGGFKMRNSWGTAWGNSGEIYLSYEFVKKYAWEAVYMTDRIGYSPTATAEIKIEHPFRNEIGVTLAGGGWSQTVYNNSGGSVPDIHTIVDISDGPSPALTEWSLLVENNYDISCATVSLFTITYNSVVYPCPDVPCVISNSGKSVLHVSAGLQSPQNKVKNFPNPFYPSNISRVTIRMPERYWGSRMKVLIYNMAGVPVRTLEESTGDANPGIGTAYWDGKNSSGDMVASGLYYYVVDTGGKKFRGNITLIK
ncbi:MAG: Papain family cysteine protease [Elusimicrobia bacterium ADurb.Bin231]|nr:MAG: Papain family cysteine protease [Elusimicrobia bacterium ADurb.Bin231]